MYSDLMIVLVLRSYDSPYKIPMSSYKILSSYKIPKSSYKILICYILISHGISYKIILSYGFSYKIILSYGFSYKILLSYGILVSYDIL